MFLISLLFACDTIETQLKLKTPEEQLIDLRFEYKESIDELYKTYGGNQLVENINTADTSKNADKVSTEEKSTTSEPVNQLMATLKNTVKAQDRAQFEANCLKIGSGHNVLLATPKSTEFFSRTKTIEGCKETEV